jgi:hypothetical protein
MVALPLFDVVLSFNQSPARSAAVAGELAKSALEDIQHVENLDEGLAPSDPSQFDRQTIALLRSMYEEWVRAAEALLERIDRLERAGTSVAGSNALRDAHGRTRAMLSLSLDQLEEGHRAAITGRGIPIQEVRRELRVGTH